MSPKNPLSKLEKFGLTLDAFQNLKKINFVERLWSKDTALWKQEPVHQKIISNSLGWLTVTEWMQEKLNELTHFAEELKREGTRHILLLGMGGSSLAPEVFRLTLPSQKGFPKLRVLDSTDPGWIHNIEKSVALKKTIFILSSKSGTTIEPLCFYKYFYERAHKNGSRFIAITDAGSYLENLAREKKFRRIFLNPSDIGGRYSALSYFGLVPAALAGMDVQGLLKSAQKMVRSSTTAVPIEKNPAVQLGIALGELAKSGRDKLTLILPGEMEALGLWIEQLVAESSGKDGRGIIPIAGENWDQPELYGNDRFFVSLSMDSAKDKKVENRVGLIEKTHPLIRIRIQAPIDLGGEFFRWEIATAVACSILGVNAFDQPDVQSAKDKTQSLLKELTEKKSLPNLPVHIQGKKFEASFSPASLSGSGSLFQQEAKAAFPGKNRSGTLSLKARSHSRTLVKFLARIMPNDYIGILAFLPFQKATDKKLNQLRTALRHRTRAATLFGYGPRYLHSTGQLHKGGPNSGAFILLTSDPEKEIKVPGERYSFGELERAQALGDFQALASKGRRAVRIHLRQPLAQSLDEIQKVIKAT